MGFSRQEYWGGCHALLQGIFPTKGLNPLFLHLLHQQMGSLPLVPPGKPIWTGYWIKGPLIQCSHCYLPLLFHLLAHTRHSDLSKSCVQNGLPVEGSHPGGQLLSPGEYGHGGHLVQLQGLWSQAATLNTTHSGWYQLSSHLLTWVSPRRQPLETKIQPYWLHSFFSR